MCGESDLKTCVAMLIMDRLDIGGSFAEFHPIDFALGVGHHAETIARIADVLNIERAIIAQGP